MASTSGGDPSRGGYAALLPFFLSSSGGVAFALTAPPTDVYPAVVVGLGLLAAALSAQSRRVPQANNVAYREGPAARPWGRAFFAGFGCGAAWGTAAGLIGLRFVPTVIQRFTSLGIAASLLALLLLAAAQSLIWAIGAGVASALIARWRVPFEIAFGGGVLIALSLPSIFLWSPAGLVSPWPAFLQLADLVGERGVSVLFAIGAAGFVRALEARSLRRGLAVVALFVGLRIHGQLRIAAIERDSTSVPVLRVGLVDQAVDPVERWNPANAPAILRGLRGLTADLESRGVDLTVWPEAAYPYALGHDERRAPSGPRAILGREGHEGHEGRAEVHGPVLLGLITSAPPERLPDGEYERNTFNSTTLVTAPGRVAPMSDKLQLLWFGETVPGGSYLPWLRRVFQRSGALLPGVVAQEQELPPSASGAPATRMAILNCYEDTLPDLGRRLVNELRPQLLVNVTNDSWFGGTAAPELHARLAAMRAIELRLDLVRAVNRGVTSWIDAAGVVRARRDEAGAGTLIVTPAVRPRPRTLYAMVGDVPAWVMLLAAALAGRAVARRTREKTSACQPEAGPREREKIRTAGP